MTKIFLGVDGGGTKTAFNLIDSSGKVLAEHITSTSYYVEVGLEKSCQILRKGTEQVLAQANKTCVDIEHGFFGLPAFGEDSEAVEKLRQLPSAFLNTQQYSCDNDMVNAWASGFAGKDGINIIAGTGAIAYGVHKQQSARCSGWGEMFGDEGSAFWIGCQGLRLFSKMSDGRLAKGPLYTIFKSHLTLSHDLDITAIVVKLWHGERSKVASLCKWVFEAHLAGDVLATNIIERAASELACTVIALAKELNYQANDSINVSYSGGVFSSGKTILTPFKTALDNSEYKFNLQAPLLSPVQGAALYASILADSPLSEDAIRHLSSH